MAFSPPQDTDVSADTPGWFQIKHGRVAPRPESPNERLRKLPPRGKAACNQRSYVFDSKPPAGVKTRKGKFGTNELMLADTISKPQARMKDPSTMNSRHAEAYAKSASTFKRQKGSLQNYLEQAVHNRHILPVQRSHQRLSPLTESLPRALSRSKTASPGDFQKLYGGLDLRKLTRATTASAATRSRAMARSLRIAKEAGLTFGNARPNTGLGMSRKELRQFREQEDASEFARDMLQARAISRMSPRLTKEQAPGYTPFDAFSSMQARPLTSTQSMRSGSRRSQRRLGRSATTGQLTRGSRTRGSRTRGSTRGAGGELAAEARPGSPSILHVVGLDDTPTMMLSLQHPHSRQSHQRPPRTPFSPIYAGSVGSRGSRRSQRSGGAAFFPEMSRSSRSRADVHKEASEVVSLIDTFERKQGLHGPGYMTRKELRELLGPVSEKVDLGLEVKRAEKEELVVAYHKWKEMIKEGLVEAPSDSEDESPPARVRQLRSTGSAASGGVTPDEGVAASAASAVDGEPSTASSATAEPKPLKFNTRKEDTGPVKRLTPRSGSQLVGFFGDQE